MAVNIEVEKGQAENTQSLIRRFQKRVQAAGILPRVRSERYYARPLSRLVVKKKRLESLKRRAAYDELVKLGKAPVRETRFRKRK